MRENHHVCQNNEPKAMCVHLLIGCICVSVGDLCTDPLIKAVHNMGKTFCSFALFECLRHLQIPATETRNSPHSLGKQLGSCSPATVRAAAGGCQGSAELQDGLPVSLKTWEGYLKVVTEAR